MNVERWKEVLVGDGACDQPCVETVVPSEHGSTLTELTYPEAGGGLKLWAPAGDLETKFLSWHISHNVLVLREHSLARPAKNKCRKYVFNSGALLPNLFVMELASHLVVLVTSESTVYRLEFPSARTKGSGGPRRRSRVPFSYLANGDRAELHSHVYNTHREDVPVCASYWLHSSDSSTFIVSCASSVVYRIEMARDGSCVERKKNFTSSGLLSMFSKRQDLTLHSVLLLPFEIHYVFFGVCSAGRLHTVELNSFKHILHRDLAELLSVPRDRLVPPHTCQHVIKAARGSSALLLAVHLAFEPTKAFVLIKPVLFNASEYKINHVTTLNCVGKADSCLVDFVVSDRGEGSAASQLVALWRTGSDWLVSRAYFNQSSEWVDVVMSSTPDPALRIPDSEEPRMFFTDLVFSGLFPTRLISDTVLALRSRLGLETEDIVSRSQLKGLAVEIVELEIQNSLMNYEIQDEEYRNVLIEHWQLFYSTLLENFMSDHQPLALLSEVSADLDGVVFKNSLSLLSISDPVEQVFLCDPSSAFALTPNIDAELRESFTRVLAQTEKVSKLVDAECWQSFLEQMNRGRQAKDLISELSENLRMTSSKGVDPIVTCCTNISDLIPMLSVILNAVPALPSESESNMDVSMNGSLISAASELQSDRLMKEFVHRHFATFVNRGLKFLFNLGVVVELVLEGGAHKIFKIRKDLEEMLSTIQALLSNYHVLHWMSVTECPPGGAFTPLDVIDGDVMNKTSETALNTLFLDTSYSGKTPQPGDATSKLHTNASSVYHSSVLAVCLEYCLDSLIASAVQKGEKTVPAIVASVSRALLYQYSPISNGTTLIKHVVGYCPSTVLDFAKMMRSYFGEKYDAELAYIELVGHLNWCERKKAVRKAHTILVHGSGTAGLRQMLQCDDADKICVGVIGLFEDKHYYREAIQLLTTMNSRISDNDEMFTVIWTKRFRANLEVGNFSDAYTCLLVLKNLEDIFKDCLQCWIVSMYEKKKLSLLCGFACTGFEDEVVDILEKKARSSSLLRDRYYAWLYSFYGSRDRNRRAAAVMYELALRLAGERQGEQALEGQHRAWNMCLLALDNCPEKDQFLPKPVFAYSAAASQPEDGGGDGHQSSRHPPYELSSLEDISRQQLMCQMKHRLVSCGLERDLATTPTPVQPAHLVSRLALHGWYDDAIALGTLCQVDLTPTFESLTSRYCNSDDFSWLHHNAMPEFAQSASKPAFKVLLLLQAYLESIAKRHEQKRYYFVVLNSLLHHHTFPPNWLTDKCQEFNRMRVAEDYLKHGYLYMCAEVATTHLQSNINILVKLKSTGSNKHPNLGTNVRLYEVLLTQLKKHGEPKSVEMYHGLRSLWDDYMEELRNYRLC